MDRSEGRDTFLWLSYFGDSMEIFAGDEKLNVKVKALHRDDKVFLEKLPEFTEGKACSLDAVEAAEQLR